jgi:hypothetical protein
MDEKKDKGPGPEKSPVHNSGIIDSKKHPSRVLDMRKSGYGIGGGYERPYRQKEKIRTDNPDGLYGPIPESGYYGGGTDDIRFKTGQAGFRNELSWYGPQFGEQTSGPKKKE